MISKTNKLKVPVRSKTICAWPGCLTTSASKYCEQHKSAAIEKQKTIDKQRGTSAQRGYNSKWRKARAAYLAVHPLCLHCKGEGKIVPAIIVDHIEPHRGDMVKFWDRNNWQPLCKRHHDIKTSTEDGGFGNQGRG